MNKDEAKITPRINKWFREVVPHSAPWEIKHTRGEYTFNIRELKTHQEDYLLAATTPHGCVFKIEDAGYNYPPFDVLHYKNSEAFVIIAFPLSVIAIEIRTFLQYTKKMTTINEDEAFAIARYTTDIKKLPK